MSNFTIHNWRVGGKNVKVIDVEQPYPKPYLKVKKYSFNDPHMRKQQDRFGNTVKVNRSGVVYALRCTCKCWFGAKKEHWATRNGEYVGLICPKCRLFHQCDVNHPFHTPEQIKEECEIAIDSLKGFINL